MTQKDKAVEHVFGNLQDLAQREEGEVTVGHVTDALGERGHGPFLFVPAIIELTPIGGIPGVPTVLALIIVLFSVQILLGHDRLALPGFLRDRGIDNTRLQKAASAVQPAARRLDRWFPGRLPALSGAAQRRAAAAICILLCLTVPPLELIPFASSAPMAVIAIFGLAMTLRDGLLMAVGFAAAIAAVAFSISLWVGE